MEQESNCVDNTCRNRYAKLECSTKCAAGDACKNQRCANTAHVLLTEADCALRLQRREQVSVEIIKTANKGFGLAVSFNHSVCNHSASVSLHSVRRLTVSMRARLSWSSVEVRALRGVLSQSPSQRCTRPKCGPTSESEALMFQVAGSRRCCFPTVRVSCRLRTAALLTSTVCTSSTRNSKVSLLNKTHLRCLNWSRCRQSGAIHQSQLRAQLPPRALAGRRRNALGHHREQGKLETACFDYLRSISAGNRVQDVVMNEELTLDYEPDFIGGRDRACRCGSSECRKVIQN